MFHQEADGISTASAAKTFVDFFYRRYGKRRCFFIVKGAETEIVRSSFLEFYKSADDFGNIDPA